MKLAVISLVLLTNFAPLAYATGNTSQTARAPHSTLPMVLAAGGSCSSWKSTCEGRGGGAACVAKFNSCKKSGCFTEGEKWGGATHCGLSKN